MRACAFFPPSLDPVLDRREGDKDAVVAPEVPTRGPIGQAVLDHQPYRQIHHAVRVLTAGRGEIGEVRIKVFAALRTVVLRIRDHEITRTPHVEIPQVVQRSMELFVSIGLITTTWTRVSLVGPTVWDDLWRWQVCNRGHPFGGIGSICTWTEHGCVLRARMLGPALYDNCPSRAIPKPGNSPTVSKFTPNLRYRLARACCQQRWPWGADLPPMLAMRTQRPPTYFWG